MNEINIKTDQTYSDKVNMSQTEALLGKGSQQYS